MPLADPGPTGATPTKRIDLNSKISRLVEYLRKHRCLVILDDFEAVLKPEELAGHYHEGYEGYQDLIVRLCEVNHNSCLLLVSSEEPTELALLAGEKVRSLKPAISEEIAREIFQEKGLSRSRTRVGKSCYPGTEAIC